MDWPRCWHWSHSQWKKSWQTVMWALLSNYLSGSFRSSANSPASKEDPRGPETFTLPTSGDTFSWRPLDSCIEHWLRKWWCERIWFCIQISWLLSPNYFSHLLSRSPKQKGGTGCGIFAIATATALAHGILNVSSFDQSAMRRHLVNCFKEHLMTPFPSTLS